MAFTADQQLQIAKVYEKAAADHMVPPQQREAFARKANWFRMLARIAEKRTATANKEQRLEGFPTPSTAPETANERSKAR